MREVGIVKRIKGKFAEVRAATEEECSKCPLERNCPASSFLRDNKNVITLRNSIGAEEGDLVSFEVNESEVLAGTFIIYIIPFIFFIVGVLLGIVLEKGLNLRLGSLENATTVLTSIVFLGVGILFVREKDKKQKNHSYITEILYKGRPILRKE